MNTLKKNSNGPTAQQMIDAIQEAQGFVTRAAGILGIGRTSFYTYLKRYATAQQALEDTREKRHEWVESKLMKQIKSDNLTAIIFYLKTQAKHLGYVERQEVDLRNIDQAIERELERLASSGKD
ncbi:MAG: hypothetical protein IMY80_07595 [Chloroflexi bacterium]|nr:hypothetical protein [Chloroflexota bacterium]